MHDIAIFSFGLAVAAITFSASFIALIASDRPEHNLASGPHKRSEKTSGRAHKTQSNAGNLTLVQRNACQ